MISKHNSRLESGISIALLLHALVCAVAALLTAFWFVDGVLTFGFETMTNDLFPLATGPTLVACAMAILWVKGQISKGKASRKQLGLYFLVAVLALFCSAGFYQDIMHDIALKFFDSHGRFGCLVLDGRPWLTSTTLPWLTFASAPIFVVGSLVVKGKQRSLPE